MPDVAGSLRGMTIDGIAFRAAADANISETITQFENSMVASSGNAMRKMMKRVPVRESVVLLTNASEREQLIALAEGLDDLQFSYTNAAGDAYRCEGTFEIESHETEENRTTVQIHPRGSWTAFIA